MVKKILSHAGFIEGKTFKETRFLKPPVGTYAIYLDSYTRNGSDDRNLITEHNYTIEVYNSTADPKKEIAIEEAFDAFGVAYYKESRYWIQEEQLYQTVYSFTHYTK